MADATQTTQDSNIIVVDKNKNAEQYLQEAEKLYIIPKLVRESFPDLIKLVYETESMDTEEREYWLQIMPIMSQQQIEKFRGILVNEKEQLEKLEKDYGPRATPVKPIDEVALQEKIKKIKEAEHKDQQAEANAEEQLLDQLENM